jgi:hypothetical protein
MASMVMWKRNFVTCDKNHTPPPFSSHGGKRLPPKGRRSVVSSELVVLRADTRIFKVFAAILKAQSSVFADMFAFPQPPSTDIDNKDGVPVVVLHDDPNGWMCF